MTEDPELEDFLRQFRPRAPGPLRRPDRRGRRWVLPLVAAAAVTAAVAVILTHRSPRGPAETDPERRLPTVGALQAAVRAGTYEASLDEMVEGTLPDPGRPGGALAVLADVGRDR